MNARGSAPVTNALLVANIVVLALWWLPVVSTETMAEGFLISWSHLAAGRIWTPLTAVFSHNALFHLLINMIVLTSFGPPLERVMGSRSFLTFYLIAGLVGSVAHATVSNFLMDRPDQAALGASSALAGVLVLYSLLFPKSRVLLFFLIPVPALLAAVAFIALDVWGLVAQIGGAGLPIGHGAHLGGALVGFVWFLMRRGSLRPRARRFSGEAPVAPQV